MANKPDSATLDLFSSFGELQQTQLSQGAFLLHGLACANAPQLLADLQLVVAQAPLRHMHTPGGLRMSVAMTNCGACGWVSDRHGYRYTAHDPVTDKPWPLMPASFLALAVHAASSAAYSDFRPDACLINRYEIGTRLSLHQDKDERDFSQPIVSVSLGIAATFLYGGMQRNDRSRRVRLQHGDVLVWGGEDRLRYHGILPLAEDYHPTLGAQRINLTFRQGL